MQPLSHFLAVGSWVLVVAAVLVGTWCLFWIIIEERAAREVQRRARVEAELDRKASQLRRSILTLAEDLARDRDEASQELTRAMFLTAEKPNKDRS